MILPVLQQGGEVCSPPSGPETDGVVTLPSILPDSPTVSPTSPRLLLRHRWVGCVAVHGGFAAACRTSLAILLSVHPSVGVLEASPDTSRGPVGWT